MGITCTTGGPGGWLDLISLLYGERATHMNSTAKGHCGITRSMKPLLILGENVLNLNGQPYWGEEEIKTLYIF